MAIVAVAYPTPMPPRLEPRDGSTDGLLDISRRTLIYRDVLAEVTDQKIREGLSEEEPVPPQVINDLLDLRRRYMRPQDLYHHT